MCRYFLRVTVSRRMSDLVREMEIWVHTLQDRPENNKEIKMEVGVEDSLHIEFEYQRSRYAYGLRTSATWPPCVVAVLCVKGRNGWRACIDVMCRPL